MYVYVIKPSHLLEISPSVREKNKNGTDRFFDPATAPLERGKNRRGREGGNIRDEKNLMSVNSPSAATCKRRKEFFLTPVIPFIARGTPPRHSAPACNGPGYWRVAVLMNFGAHVLRETRGTSRMPPDAGATILARKFEESRWSTPTKRCFFVNLFFEISQFLFRTHPIDSCLVSYRSDIRGIFGEGNEII